MSSTDKVLGTIGALATLIDNFPMSILDLFKGKKYTSIFEFLMDILLACGVPVDEAIEWLLKNIFSVEVYLEGGLDKMNEALSRGDYKSREDSKFLRGLDVGIKGILMALLTSLYGCSSIPVLPNKVMDYPDPSIFSGATKEKKNNQTSSTNNKQKMWDALWRYQIYPARFDIPAKIIDPIGMLSISPTSSEGRLFYDIDGKDIYYRKKETSNPGSVNILNSIEDIKLYFIKTIENNNTYLQITTDEDIFEDIDIVIEYLDINGNNLLTWNTTLKIHDKISDKLLIKKDDNIKIGRILKIKLNGEVNKCVFNLIVGKTYCYFSYEKSEESIKEFQQYDIFKNIVWGENEQNSNVILGVNMADTEEDIDDDINIPSIGDSDFEEMEEPVYYVYEMLSEKPEDFKKAKRMASAPTTANEKSPDLVVVYVGSNPNDLYKTYDMNAFIWYTLNRSTRAAQIDINHTMWDSRLKHYRQTKNELTNEDLNNWYNSKKTAKDEFLNIKGTVKDGKYPRIEKKDTLYPILQLKKAPNNLYGVTISFPSQRYYKPTFRKRFIKNNGDATGKIFSFNSTIYKFNWDYLESIQILKPRLLLANFVNYLTGGIMNEVTNAEFNITKEIIKNKVSTATKKIIEADDGQIDDCYSTFSNDEFDIMLEDMLLSRYDMTYYDGNNSKVRKHDVNSYIASLDSVNASTSREESVTKMVKLVEDVSTTPGSEGSVNFGFETSIDKSIISRLIWSLVMSIIDSLFTPQVMLLIIINMNLSGAVKINEFGKDDFGALLNLVINKIMGLIKSIIKFIIEKIAEMLFQFILNKLMPLIIKWMAALKIEELRNWLNILVAAINCLPQLDLKFNITKLGGLDEVNYADIIDTGTTSTPEASSTC